MKKIKFMLLSLALVAVVGGALAFKAKRINTFCTTLAAQVNNVSTCVVNGVTLRCTNFKENVKIDNDADGIFYCTTTPWLKDGVLTCTSETISKKK
jgi:hypothetical protein